MTILLMSMFSQSTAARQSRSLFSSAQFRSYRSLTSTISKNCLKDAVRAATAAPVRHENKFHSSSTFTRLDTTTAFILTAKNGPTSIQTHHRRRFSYSSTDHQRRFSSSSIGTGNHYPKKASAIPPEFESSFLRQDSKEALRQKMLAQTILTASQNHKIRYLGFLRHGQTSPKPQDGTDFDRQLTEEGRQQARAAGRQFAVNYPDCAVARPMLCSAAPRTVETAQLFGQAMLENDAGTNDADTTESTISLLPLVDLYDGTMQPEGSRLFQAIGYAPLQDYLWQQQPQDAHDDSSATNKDELIARTLLGNYARTVLDAILNVTTTLCQDDANDPTTTQADDGVLFVVGHAVYLPAAALGVASLLVQDNNGNDNQAPWLEPLLVTNTREAEGYLIDLQAATAAATTTRAATTSHGVDKHSIVSILTREAQS